MYSVSQDTWKESMENDIKLNIQKKKRKKKMSGLNMSLLVMTLIPLLLLGLIVSIFVYSRLTNIMYSEIEEELKNTALIVQHTYEYAYPGDYKSVGKEQVAIVKGEKVLNGDYSLIDNIKEETDSEVTLFYGNTRILTTIVDDNGNRVIGTTIRNSVVEQVLGLEASKFYDNIMVDENRYFSYYMPLKNSDNSCVGMIAVLKKADVVKNKIFHAVMPALIIIFAGMIIMAYISYKYSSNLIKRINKIKDFLIKTSNGDFKVRLDENVLHNKDEISEMGRFAENMQHSLRNMVEQDALTGINNRRYGDKILIEIHEKYQKNGTPFSIAIADIDWFKSINDTYGHQCGDLVLKEIAEIFKESMTGKGFAVRWGGEEFLLVFEEYDLEEAYEYLAKIVGKIREKEVNYNEDKIKVTVTCGLVEGSNEPVHVIVREADNKLYEGKQNGRDRIVR